MRAVAKTNDEEIHLTCFCFTFVSRSFWTLELTRRRNLTVSISFGCLAQERQSEVIGSAVKKSLCERFVFWKDGSGWFWCLGTPEELVFI